MPDEQIPCPAASHRIVVMDPSVVVALVFLALAKIATVSIPILFGDAVDALAYEDVETYAVRIEDGKLQVSESS